MAIPAVAKMLAARKDIVFVVSGDGVMKPVLQQCRGRAARTCVACRCSRSSAWESSCASRDIHLLASECGGHRSRAPLEAVRNAGERKAGHHAVTGSGTELHCGGVPVRARGSAGRYHDALAAAVVRLADDRCGDGASSAGELGSTRKVISKSMRSSAACSAHGTGSARKAPAPGGFGRAHCAMRRAAARHRKSFLCGVGENKNMLIFIYLAYFVRYRQAGTGRSLGASIVASSPGRIRPCPLIQYTRSRLRIRAVCSTSSWRRFVARGRRRFWAASRHRRGHEQTAAGLSSSTTSAPATSSRYRYSRIRI